MILLAVTVVSLPVGYALSVGPAIWVAARYPASQRIIGIGFKPLGFAADHGVFKSLGVEDALNSYAQWWLNKATRSVTPAPATSPVPKAP
jgi:hypothetical protein